jgi:transcriptional regulator with XRE-family HTH domain
LEILLRVHSMADIAATVRGRRLDRGLSQSALAQRCGVSRKWVSEFETGKTKAEFVLVLRVLGELGLVIDLVEAASSAVAMSSTGTMSVSANVWSPADGSWNLDELLEEHRRT